MQRPWVHQALCCVSFAIVVVSIAGQKANSFVYGRLGYPVYEYLFPLLNIHRNSRFAQYWYLLALAFVLSSIVFPIILFLMHFRRVRSFLLALAGCLSIAAYPCGSLCEQMHWDRISPSRAVLLSLQILIIVILVMLYFFKKWPIKNRFIAVLLTLHFSFWLWVSGNFAWAFGLVRAYGFSDSGSWFVIIIVLLLPIVGFASSYTWAVCVKE